MAIKWTDGNYNVANVAIDTAITHGVKTEIGKMYVTINITALS